MRAVATLRLRFADEIAAQLIENIVSLGSESTFLWTAAACAGWSGAAVKDFLSWCVLHRSRETGNVAMLSLQGKYQNCRHL